MAVRLIPGYLPIYIIAALSIAGLLCVLFAPNPLFNFVLANRWSPQYLLLAPFFHGGFAHAFFNLMMLHFIGGQLVLPSLGMRRFALLFVAAALFGNIVNNILSASPAIGISGAVMALLAFSLFRFSHLPVKLLLIHDVLRLRPFPLWTVAAFAVVMDMLGLILGWQFFAHWAHLAGFACGAVAGWWYFVHRSRRSPPRRTVH